MSDPAKNMKKYCCKIFLRLKIDKIRTIPLKYKVGIVFICVAALIILLHSGSSGDDPIIIEVKPGMQTAQIAALLKEKNIISHDTFFEIEAKFKGLDKKLQTGQYVFHSNMSSSDVLNELLAGPQQTVIKVTIPEGYTVEQIADLLEKKNVTSKKDFLELAKKSTPYDYMKNDDKNVKYKLEGYLFPDTYEFIRGSSAQKVIYTMTGQFNKELTKQMRERAKEENLSIHELITLASLVEAEAKFTDDRPLIAQVFFNRLKINMPLQSDTTIQYARVERKENLSIKDTKIDSPYNTYLHYGLPPGAVGNPGLASIKAVLYPQANDYLYFVADSQGHNHYNKTYEEHLATLRQIN